MRLIDADELIIMEYGGIEFVPKEFIDEAPTVDSVKHGEWEDSCGDWRCDQCGAEMDLYMFCGEANYCPNCGAKMDGGEE